MGYQQFLESKRHTSTDLGIEVNFIPDGLFDFQEHVSIYAIKKGRCAVLLDTGLGKTIIELTIAKNYVNKTNKPVHKLIVEDSTKCFTAMPDYVLIFTRKGDNEVPVTHFNGLTEYFGATPFLEPHKETYGNYDDFRKKWVNFKGDPRENKLSHITWQRYASSVWDDIRIDNVLPFKNSKDPDDEKHVHPLQLDVIDRLVV